PDGAAGPGDEFVAVLQDVRWNLKVAHRQGAIPFLVRKGPAAALDVSRARTLVGFEIEPAAEEDREKGFGLIQTMPAEHRPRAQSWQRAELVDHEIPEGIISHAAERCHTPGQRPAGSAGRFFHLPRSGCFLILAAKGTRLL